MHHLRFGLSRRLVGGSKDDTVVFLTLYVDRTKLGAHNLQLFCFIADFHPRRNHKKYQNLKSDIKDVIVEGNRIAFRAKQHAFFVPDDKQVNMDVMNVYTLVDGRVKEWQLWFKQEVDSVS